MSGDESSVDDVPVADEPEAAPSTPAASDPPAHDDLWLDDDFDDDGPRKGISPLVIVLGAVAILGVIIVLLATGGSGSDSDAKTGGSNPGTETEAGGSDQTATTVKRGPAWPAVVQGRPAAFGQLRDPITSVSPEAEPGVYFWLDFDGWHLWIASPNGKAAAKGTLTSNEDLGPAQVAVPDQGIVNVAGKSMTFDFSGVDAAAAGVSFNLGFYASEVTVSLGGTDLPLLLGKSAAPSPIPAVITKQVQPS